MVKASIHSIWMSWIPWRCRYQSSIYWYLTFQQKKLERNERTFLLPLWQQYSTLLLMLNRSAMFTKNRLLSFFPPHITWPMKQPPFPRTHDPILCMPCCCEVLGKGIEMSETINFHSEVHRQYKVRDVGPNCLCELPGGNTPRQLKQRIWRIEAIWNTVRTSIESW